MSFNQGVYDTSLAYGKFRNYTGAVVAVLIGIVLIILSIVILVSYIRQPKTKTDEKNNASSEQNVQNAPWWTGPMVFGFALICFLSAFYYYKLVTTAELAPVVATQGALGFGSDVSEGLRDIILGNRRY